MDLSIQAESRYCFAIESAGKSYVLQQDGGTWMVTDNHGGMLRNLGDRRLDWPEALKRALVYLTTEVTNS